MHPRLQNGACSGTDGLPHRGQDLVWSGVLGIPARHGYSGVGSLPNCAAKPSAEMLQPCRFFRQAVHNCRAGDEAFGTGRFIPGAAQQGTCFEPRAILSKVEE